MSYRQIELEFGGKANNLSTVIQSMYVDKLKHKHNTITIYIKFSDKHKRFLQMCKAYETQYFFVASEAQHKQLIFNKKAKGAFLSARNKKVNT